MAPPRGQLQNMAIDCLKKLIPYATLLKAATLSLASATPGRLGRVEIEGYCEGFEASKKTKFLSIS